MRALVLRAGAGQLDLLVVKVNLLPLKVTNFDLPLASQNQQSKDAAVIIITSHIPDCDQLRLAQHPLTPAIISTSGDALHRRDLGVRLVDCPSEEAR
jgi:hypothetical protein